MLWDVKGFVKRLASVVGLAMITVGAFVAIAAKYCGLAVVQFFSFVKSLFAWQGLSLRMNKAATYVVRGLRVVINAIVPGFLLLSRLIVAACRWLGGTVSFLGTVFKQMLSWQGIVKGSGRAVQAVRNFPRAFVNRAVLLNPPFYMVYTAVSLVVLLTIGSLVYWQYGNVFTRYALAQHQAVDKMTDGTDEIDQLQDIQNRLEARITATEQRLRELEMKTVSLEKQTEEKLEDVTQEVDARVEKFEQKAQSFVSVVAQKTKALDQQVSHQQAAFAQTVAKVEKHASAIDVKAQKLDAMTQDVHKSVAAFGKTTKQQVESLTHHVNEKTGAVERNVQQQVATLHQKVARDIDAVTTKQAQHAAKVIERLDALDESNKELATQTQQEVAQVHKKIDTTHQATQQTLTHLEKSINEKTAAVDQKVQKQMASLEHKVSADVEAGIGKHAQHIALVNDKVAGLHKEMKQHVGDLEKGINEKTAAVDQKVQKQMASLEHKVTADVNEKTSVVAVQAKQALAQVAEQLDEQVTTVNKKVDAATLYQQKALEKQVSHIDTFEKDTQKQIKAVSQKTAEVESRVGTLERADVQEARRLSVIGHHVQQEVNDQMKKLRNDALESKKKAERKKVLARFLDQLADEEN